VKGLGEVEEGKEGSPEMWEDTGWSKRARRGAGGCEGTLGARGGARGVRRCVRGLGVVEESKEGQGEVWGDSGWSRRRRRGREMCEGTLGSFMFMDKKLFLHFQGAQQLPQKYFKRW
jgi:hypothetical protein